MEFHPLADIFPMMSAEEYAALKDDIATHGLREIITLAEDKIADGRNRYKACVELGIELRYEEWDGVGSLLAFIISKNLHRRHLSESQRAMVAAKIANLEVGRPEVNCGNSHNLSQSDTANLFSIDRWTVNKAKKVLSEGTPELAEAVEQGEIAVSLAAKVSEWEESDQGDFLAKVTDGATPAQAKRQIEHGKKRSQTFPIGRFQVIYADPPWSYSNTGFDEAADAQYPTMIVEKICTLPVGDLSTDGSVLFLWVPNPLLEDGLKVLGAWGFQYKTNMAWVKDKARGKGWWLKSKHELLLIGVRSKSPQPAIRPPSAFEADRGPVHSRKPEKAYEIIEAMYPGSKIELFSRNNREGWTMWGNEDATT